MNIAPEQALMMQERWQADPILFMTEVLDVKQEHVWDKMEDVAYSVRDNLRTCVYAGHGVSKSFSAARIALWFLTAYGPKATVITTAPSNDQVENILWREIAVAYNGAKYQMDGVLTRKKLDMGSNLEPPEGKWFAYGFATTPDTVTGEATRFQGYHNDHILVIFDEAAGILPQIWRAAEHLLTSGHTRWLAIGNPTSPYGNFAACEDDDKWSITTISVKDTPNFKAGKDVIPGVSGREYEKTMRDKYGEDSNEYKVRICGKKPSYGEGTFYGERVAQAEQRNHIRDFPIEHTIPVHTFWDVGPRNTAIIFARLVNGWLQIVDADYDDTGRGWSGHAIMLQRKPYIYGDHWAPTDLIGSNARNMSGEVNIDLAREAGIDFKIMMAHSFADRIAATNNIIATKVLFYSKSPGVQMLLSALRKYRQRRNEQLSTDENPSYFKDPVKDWTRHPADAFGGMAIVYRFNGIALYLPDAEPVGALSSWDYDPFEGGL
ncbi:hypothetical protein LCGC14_0885400 [marine sediment metagenome]|uniref:Terminase large subunit gp17-like C-terminal domain-containing protein n=1 Tax=marine sediment metagenome TaxID=412755 RepID=A0A0F9P0T0_9ZZZZ